MGFIAPAPPPVDVAEWKELPHLARIKPLAQDWAINGFGTPTAIYLLYAVKLVVFSLGAMLTISATTSGLGGLGDFSDWWTQPIVFEKLAVWTLLWEIIGLGCGSMPLTFRFLPPIGGILYWLRPGTVRLPPWPDKVPLTAGTTRTPIDVVLYAGVLASGFHLLLARRRGGERPRRGAPRSGLDRASCSAFLGLLGLRDKVSFLGARPEVYGFLLIVFLFPINNLIVASQLVFVCIWLGAASSKLNRHFPFVVSVMISQHPLEPLADRPRRAFTVATPTTCVPSRYAGLAAHLGTVIEFTLPLVLLFSKGGTIG